MPAELFSGFADDEAMGDGPDNAPVTDKADIPEEKHVAASKKDNAGNESTAGAGRSFEDAYSRLETLVDEIESGELPLEELISRFEEGVGLVRHCQQFLKQARLRVEQYVEQKDGQWILKDIKAGDE